MDIRKILIVGDFKWLWYQEAFASSFEKKSLLVLRFGWFTNFWKTIPNMSEPQFKSILHKLQYRFTYGPLIFLIKKNLFNLIEIEKPDLIFFYNVRLLDYKVIKKIKKILPYTILCQYSNDNPFSPLFKNNFWKNFKDSVPFFDIHFIFRESNRKDFLINGAIKIDVLKPYFIDYMDYNIPIDQIPDDFKSDIVFAGHYENDGRLDKLEEILQKGYNLKIFGGGWNEVLSDLNNTYLIKSKFPISPVINDEYRFAICGSKIALCFLSKLNNDTYTRRNFQIPAMKTLVLSEFTEDLANQFIENQEICFFRNTNDLIEKIDLLLKDDILRNKIAINGYNRNLINKNSVDDRTNQILNFIKYV
jgi:spore maturation protein CgeB